MELGKQKKPTRDKDGEDKISKLPDALIHHIYSFLPTKCVLSTCILSKRWRDLSNSAPILDFGNWYPHRVVSYLDAEKIMDFVDNVLFDHDRPKIQKFVLTVHDHFDETRVNRWIRAVIKRKVEELVLSIIYKKESFIFPLSFFTCESLIVLDLDYNFSLNLPNTVSFPRLKTLRLRYICFGDGYLTGELFSYCPILEELSLFNCQFEDLEVFYIKSSTLKQLSIQDGVFFDSTLKIVAPNLLTINYAGVFPADFVLDSFPSLVEADINIINRYHDASECAALSKLYQKLSNVKLLKMSGGFYRGLSEANILLADLPTFCNLVHLEFSSGFYSWHPDPGSIPSMRIFLLLLQLSPNLESILYSQGVISHLQYDNWALSSSPQYFLSSLKSVVLQRFSGCKGELDVVKFFLANAGALQTMSITTSRHISKDYKKQMQVASELLKFPRSSSSCVLEFLTPSSVSSSSSMLELFR